MAALPWRGNLDPLPYFSLHLLSQHVQLLRVNGAGRLEGVALNEPADLPLKQTNREGGLGCEESHPRVKIVYFVEFLYVGPEEDEPYPLDIVLGRPVHLLGTAFPPFQEDLVCLPQRLLLQLLEGTDGDEVGRKALFHHVEVDGIESLALGDFPEPHLLLLSEPLLALFKFGSVFLVGVELEEDYVEFGLFEGVLVLGWLGLWLWLNPPEAGDCSSRLLHYKAG